METMYLIFQFLATCIGKFLVWMNSSWLMTMCLYISLLSLVVSILVVVRGTK